MTVFHTSIMKGEVFHQRNKPKIHSFTYPVFFLRIVLESYKSDFSKVSKFLLSNEPKKSILSFSEEDYLKGYSGDLKEKVSKVLKEHGELEYPETIVLYTLPRIFNYVFNPVSFFVVYSKKGDLLALIAEVHNTFKEAYLYVLTKSKLRPDSHSNSRVNFEDCKEFHVSPFFDREGEYIFSIKDSLFATDIRVNLKKEDKIIFVSKLEGESSKLTSRNIIKTIILYPMSIVGTFPRIVWQAVLLKFVKGLKVYSKPIAEGRTLLQQSGPGILQKISLDMFKNFIMKARCGQLEVAFPDGSSFITKESYPGPQARIEVKNYNLFTRSFFSGDIGFGESYVDNEWDSPDLTEVLSFFSNNIQYISDRKVITSYLGRILNLILHRKNKNSHKGSKKNIHAHYDLSNDLFTRFLCDKTMYSSAIFREESSSISELDLDLGQQEKLKSICEKAKLKPSDHVLEIGCGWGGFAIFAAKNYGCKVTGITLSEEQLKLAKERVSDAKLEHLIDLKICDYRDLEGQFSKIVSIEMIEAVGKEFLPDFFAKCDQLLEPNGIIVLQSILIPDQRYKAYSLGSDWLQKYIFPGGHCPSLSSLSLSAASSSSLVISGIESFPESYANTLHIWRKKFLENWEDIRKYNFDDRFKRMWLYYLSYCEAGFRSRLVDVQQIVFSRTIREL